MKILKKTLFAAILVFIGSQSFAQDIPWNWATDSAYRKYSYDSITGPNLYIVPQYFLVKGLRMDVEFRLSKRKNSWLGIGPQFFISKEESSSDFDKNSSNSTIDYGSYKDFVGIGALVYYRAFLIDNSLDGIYLNLGMNTCYFKGEIADNVESSFGTYKQYRNASFSKLGPDFCIGYQANPFPRFYLDGYLGVGMRYTVVYEGGKLPKELTNYAWSYGYTGVVPNIGFRVGVAL